MKHIGLTGASGLLGKHVIFLLLKKNYSHIEQYRDFLITKAARGKRWELVEILREGRAKKEGVKPALSVNITGDFDLVFMRLPLRSLSEFTFFLNDVPNISKMGEIALSHNRHIANIIHY